MSFFSCFTNKNFISLNTDLTTEQRRADDDRLDANRIQLDFDFVNMSKNKKKGISFILLANKNFCSRSGADIK